MTADRLTPEERAELRRLMAAATPGPAALEDGRIYHAYGADAELAVALRNALPALLAAAEREAEAHDTARGAHVVVEAAQRLRAEAERDRDALRAALARAVEALRGTKLGDEPGVGPCYCDKRDGWESDDPQAFWAAPHDDNCREVRAILADPLAAEAAAAGGKG